MISHHGGDRTQGGGAEEPQPIRSTCTPRGDTFCSPSPRGRTPPRDGVHQLLQAISAGDEARALEVFHGRLAEDDLATLWARSGEGSSVLQEAARKNMPALSQCLLDSFAAADIPVGGLQATLFDAACAGFGTVCGVLLASPLTDPNAVDAKGRTALHGAALSRQLETSALLVGHPRFTAACARTTKHGFTALHCAAMMGFGDVCSLLVQHHRFLPAVEALSRSGKSALDVARGEARAVLQRQGAMIR